MLSFEHVSSGDRVGAGMKDLTLRVEPGEIVALIGLNGSGKTTLMRLALRMVRPQQGTVQAFGKPLETVACKDWALVGALIKPAAGYSELTVRENPCIASLSRGTDPQFIEDSLNIWRLIVLDEPTSNLDPASVTLLRGKLTDRAREGTATLVSSHHLDEVAGIADRVLLLNAGHLIGELDTTGNNLEHAFFERIREDDKRCVEVTESAYRTPRFVWNPSNWCAPPLARSARSLWSPAHSCCWAGLPRV